MLYWSMTYVYGGYGCYPSLTFLLHVDSQALLEPARLTLVSPCHVHDTIATLLAHVVKVPETNIRNT